MFSALTVALSTTTETPGLDRRNSSISSVPSPSGRPWSTKATSMRPSRVRPPERLPGLGERPHLGHHLEIGLALEHEGEDLPEGGVVLHKHNPELFGFAHVRHLPRSLATARSMLPSAED